MPGSKRALDVTVSAIALVVAAPLIVALGILILVRDGWPVIYGSRRVGQGGRPFTLWKLRTMERGADRSARGSVTVAGDPRITATGRVLRTWKLDELPQLVNVLTGECSLVGPRPEVPSWVERYTAEQREILRYRPGLTSPATLAFVDEEAVLSAAGDPEAAYLHDVLPRELQIDLDYMRTATLRSDVRVLVSTLTAMLRQGGTR